MSLVNDMLRDLDRRRQEPTSSGIGAERLIPVPHAAELKSERFSLFAFAMTIAVTLTLIMAFLYFRQASLVSSTPPQPVFTPAPVAPAPQPVSPEAAPVQIVGVDPQEHELVTARLQALEAENRALIEAQAAREVATAPAEPEIAPAPSAISQASAAIDQVDAIVQSNAQTARASTVPNVQEEVASPAPSGVVRSRRELSFSEQDQLQAQDAMRLVSRNQLDQAVLDLRKFLGENPNAHISRETLIKLAMQRNETAVAEDLLNAGLALAPTRDAFRKLQARMFLSSGKSADALQVLTSRIPSVADDLEFHDLLATAYLSAQDFANAASTYESLVQLNRNEARWWYGLASSWDSLGRNRDARLAYEQAMNLPNLSASLRQRSQIRVAEIGN